jgi:hypothetical protein
VVLGLIPEPTSPRLPGSDELDRLNRAAATRRLAFGLAVASINGRFRRVGRLLVADRLSDTLDALRFNPFNCGGGLEPTGALNRLRDYAYPLSQAAWARRDGRADAQLQAEAELRLCCTQPMDHGVDQLGMSAPSHDPPATMKRVGRGTLLCKRTPSLGSARRSLDRRARLQRIAVLLVTAA